MYEVRLKFNSPSSEIMQFNFAPFSHMQPENECFGNFDPVNDSFRSEKRDSVHVFLRLNPPVSWKGVKCAKVKAS